MMEETWWQDIVPAGWKSCKDGSEVVRAVIEIGSEVTSLLVASTEEGKIRPLLERRQELVAARMGARALSAIVQAEAATAREVGAESVAVMIEPELRGSHLVRGLDRHLHSAGLGPFRTPTAAERGSLTFRGATAEFAASAPSSEIAVVELARHVTAIAVGRPGMRPRWWAARPLHGSRLLQTALRNDPPTLAEYEVALGFARRELANLKPPSSRQAVLIGADASLVALACGDFVDAVTCERARMRFGHLSEISAAQLGVSLSVGRRLPAALAIVQAVSELLGHPVRIVHGGSAEGLLLSEAEEVGAGGPAHA